MRGLTLVLYGLGSSGMGLSHCIIRQFLSASWDRNSSLLEQANMTETLPPFGLRYAISNIYLNLCRRKSQMFQLREDDQIYVLCDRKHDELFDTYFIQYALKSH